MSMTDVSSSQQTPESMRQRTRARSDRQEDPRRSPRRDPEDDGGFLPVERLRRQFMDYLDSKVDEIEEQKESRRYYHGGQWTPAQIAILRRRHQPPITWNRVARKINGIVGVVERMRSDPKAEPTTPASEQGANLATHVIREVLDENEWKSIEPWCLLQAGIDGIAGVQMVLTEGDEQDPDISLPFVIGDEYFYDPKSYKQDFSDARYEGIAKWLTIDEAVELFPDREQELRGLIEGDADLTSNPDREYKWIITSSKTVRLVEHWYKHRGQWRWAFYVSSVLLDQGLSPFFGSKGKRVSSFNMFSMAVDHDGDRYGFVRNLKGPQDALNQSKSKSLHLANSRRLISDKGAVDDVETARIEWSRPDGFVEVNPGKKITPDATTADLQAFNGFAEDAKSELDQYANTNVAALSGVNVANLSGRAIELLRQPGMAELGPFVLAIRAWKLRLFRMVWNTAQRYWNAERWIRVTNDQGLKQFIKLNGLGLDQYGRPSLVNALGAVDVNITFEEGPDVASVMEDVYNQLKGYPPGTFPPQVLIEMSSLPRTEKNRILQMMTPKPQPPNPMQQAATHLKLEEQAVKNAKTAADARFSDAKAHKALVDAGTGATDSAVGLAEFQTNLVKEALGLMQPPQQPQRPLQPTPQPTPAMPVGGMP